MRCFRHQIVQERARQHRIKPHPDHKAQRRDGLRHQKRHHHNEEARFHLVALTKTGRMENAERRKNENRR